MRKEIPTPDGTLFALIILPEGSAVPATSDAGLEWPSERVYLEPLNGPVPLPDGCDQAVWGQSLIEEVNADLKRVGLPPLVLTHPIQYRGKPPGTYSTVLVSDETFEAVLEQARARRWSRVGRDIERLFSNPGAFGAGGHPPARFGRYADRGLPHSNRGSVAVLPCPP